MSAALRLVSLQHWRAQLAQRPSVANAVAPDYQQRLSRFVLAQGSALSQRVAIAAPSAPWH